MRLSIGAVRAWLITLAVIHLVGGLLLIPFAFTPLLESGLELLPVPRPGTGIPEIRFLVALFGPTIASWGLLLLVCAMNLSRLLSPGNWWLLVAAVLVWAVLDTSLCLGYGYYPVVWLNLPVTVALLLPMWLGRHHFDGR